MIYLVLYLAVFILWLTIELLRAPIGYEDENGFHICDVRSERFKVRSLSEG